MWAERSRCEPEFYFKTNCSGVHQKEPNKLQVCNLNPGEDNNALTIKICQSKKRKGEKPLKVGVRYKRDIQVANDAVVRGGVWNASLARVKSMSWVCHKDRIGT